MISFKKPKKFIKILPYLNINQSYKGLNIKPIKTLITIILYNWNNNSHLKKQLWMLDFNNSIINRLGLNLNNISKQNNKENKEYKKKIMGLNQYLVK